MMRHPADYRDELEHADVAAVLAELPEDHPARAAYYSGQTSDTIALTHLLVDRMDMVERLKCAYLAHDARIWARYKGTGAVSTRQGLAKGES